MVVVSGHTELELKQYESASKWEVIEVVWSNVRDYE